MFIGKNGDTSRETEPTTIALWISHLSQTLRNKPVLFFHVALKKLIFPLLFCFFNTSVENEFNLLKKMFKIKILIKMQIFIYSL